MRLPPSFEKVCTAFVVLAIDAFWMVTFNAIWIALWFYAMAALAIAILTFGKCVLPIMSESEAVILKTPKRACLM